MSEQNFFMIVLLMISRESSDQSTSIFWSNIRSKPFGPSKSPDGPVKPRLASDVDAREGNVVDSRDRDRMRDLLAGQPEQLPCSCGRGDCKLNGMVEALCHDRHHGGEPALDLIGDREGKHEVLARRLGVFRRSQDGAEIVTGMT